MFADPLFAHLRFNVLGIVNELIDVAVWQIWQNQDVGKMVTEASDRDCQNARRQELDFTVKQPRVRTCE